ncbi:MAG: hypothetical protein NC821_06400 [Candidatus Omnitrophica bacterium]|nr:hypothetical protein [Candidatus Omnitrophota bacterium]
MDKLDLTKLDPLGQLGTGEMTPGKLLQEFLGALGIGFLRRNPTPGK